MRSHVGDGAAFAVGELAAWLEALATVGATGQGGVVRRSWAPCTELRKASRRARPLSACGRQGQSQTGKLRREKTSFTNTRSLNGTPERRSSGSRRPNRPLPGDGQGRPRLSIGHDSFAGQCLGSAGAGFRVRDALPSHLIRTGDKPVVHEVRCHVAAPWCRDRSTRSSWRRLLEHLPGNAARGHGRRPARIEGEVGDQLAQLRQ